jgi:hypothetical protein
VTAPIAPQPRIREVGKSFGAAVAREHPTLLLTFVYLALTFVGMTHDWWFYRYFKINILDFSETSDFLLAAIRNPLVIVLSILPVGLVYLLQRFREVAIRRSPWYEAMVRKYEGTVWNSLSIRIAIYGAFVVVYAILFTQLYSFREASRIKAGKAGLRVAFMRTDGVVSDEQPVLLGTTGKFLLLYYPSRKATEIVPIDNAALITVDSRRKKEREADSLARARDADSTVRREAPEDSGRDSENPD